MKRTIPLMLGLLALLIAWLVLAPQSIRLGFLGHMTMHVLVIAIAAPLLALGLAGSRFDPTPHVPLLFAPILATVLEFAVVWGWHAPALHFAARVFPSVLALEQLTFLIAGLLVWLSAFGGDGRASGPGILGLFLTSMHMTLLGALLASSPRLLFDPAICGTGGFTPLQDQHLGGVLMLLVGGTSYLVGGLALMARLLRTSEAGSEEVGR